MDAAVTAAISAVHLDDDATAQRWFEHVCATHHAEPADWSAFRARLADEAPGAGVDSRLVERFVEYLSTNDSAPMDTIGRMAELATELPAHHRQLTAEAEPGETGGYDEAAWHRFLPEHAARWDGTDASWDQFHAWFAYEAEQQGLAAPANGFLTYVVGTADKVAAFAEYGVTIATGGAAQDGQSPDVRSYPEVRHGDSGEWVDYLDGMLARHGF
ncbi:hypothetical protein [Actinophytocola sediminis]